MSSKDFKLIIFLLYVYVSLFSYLYLYIFYIKILIFVSSLYFFFFYISIFRCMYVKRKEAYPWYYLGWQRVHTSQITKNYFRKILLNELLSIQEF